MTLSDYSTLSLVHYQSEHAIAADTSTPFTQYLKALNRTWRESFYRLPA
jgi:hypothetical protein